MVPNSHSLHCPHIKLTNNSYWCECISKVLRFVRHTDTQRAGIGLQNLAPRDLDPTVPPEQPLPSFSSAWRATCSRDADPPSWLGPQEKQRKEACRTCPPDTGPTPPIHTSTYLLIRPPRRPQNRRNIAAQRSSRLSQADQLARHT